MAAKTGRPTSFKKETAKQAAVLSQLGATDQEMADFFEIDVRTLYRWKHTQPEFCQALKAGKETADDRVERSLFMKAVGYEQDEVKIFMPSGADAPVYAPFRAKVPPDTTAAIFWLKNRRSEQWRDMSKLEHTGANGGPIQTEEISDRDAVGRMLFLIQRARKEKAALN